MMPRFFATKAVPLKSASTVITLYGTPIVTQMDAMANLQFHQFPCLSDNYGVLVHDPDAGLTAPSMRRMLQRCGKPWPLNAGN